MYYTYMLRCEDKSMYTGITTDPERRFTEHSSQGRKATGYTRSHKAESLIALWRSGDRSLASRLEYGIKQLDKQKKEQLARTGSLELFRDRLPVEEYTFVPVNEVIK